MKSKNQQINDPEIAAIQAVYSALEKLDASSQERVIDYVGRKLALPSRTSSREEQKGQDTSPDNEAEAKQPDKSAASDREPDTSTDGISPVAIKWMRRNGLTPEQLSPIFSLGIEDIDLVAKAVPGKARSEKMKNVFLLKGAASYLSNGAARFTHQQVKEACLHYDAYDTDNFANYLKKLTAEVSGSKESGYSLTARGLTEATELIKKLVSSSA